MKMKTHVSFLISFLMILIFSVTAFGQEVVKGKKLLIKKETSLQATDKKIYKATKSIHFEPGFRAKEGCYLSASVVDDASTLGAVVHEESKDVNQQFVLYPNPGSGKISFNGITEPTWLTVYDDTGSPAVQIMISHESPSVDVSALKNGTYIFKISDESIRFIKR